MDLFWRPPTLETDRLWLRGLCEADVPSVFAYCSDPAVTEHTLFETHETLADTREFVVEYARSRSFEEVPEPLGLFLKDRPEEAVGTVGCYWASQPNGVMEMGYALAPWQWGRGLIVEAATALLGHVFAHYPVERVQAKVFVENDRSAAVARKLGMSLEGTLRRCVYRRGRFRDLHVFAVLRHEWAIRGRADA